MNTIFHEPLEAKPLLDRREWEHGFFVCISLLILVAIWYEFARSYFLAGVLRAPLPIFVLVIQTSLMAAGRVNWGNVIFLPFWEIQVDRQAA